MKEKMKAWIKEYDTILIVAIAFIILMFFVALTMPAHAQIAGGGLGGGGAGALSQLLQWVMSNIINGLIGIVIVFVGARLALGHHTIAGVITVAIGIVIIAQWQTIAGLFGLA